MRDSFIFYRSFKEAISGLSDSDKLAVYEAICDYSLDFKEPQLSGFPKALFTLIRPQLDANIQRWKNASKGGAPIGNRNAIKVCDSENNKQKNNRKTTKKQPKNNQKQANVNENVNVNENESMRTAKACTHSLTGGESYNRYVSSIQEIAPYIFSHYTNLITEPQLAKLQETYTMNDIVQTIAQIENRRDLRKKYTNLYMTVKNWLKNEKTK